VSTKNKLATKRRVGAKNRYLRCKTSLDAAYGADLCR